MRAIGYREAGAALRPDAFVEFETERPEPGPTDILVRVCAVSVNPVDTKLRGFVPPVGDTPRVLGFDASGIVEAVGSGVTLFKAGDEVYYAGELGRQGSNAEFQLVDERIAGHKPKGLDWRQAAALPLTSITAWELLFDRLSVPHGRKTESGTLLVIGGAGGVGSILIQLARRLTGLKIVATASRPETAEWCHKLGAHHVVDHRKALSGELKALGIPKAEFVASLVASDHYRDEILRLIAPQGRIAITDNPGSFDIAPFLQKAVTVSGEAMFVRSLFKTSDMIEQHRLLEEVSRLVDDGVLRTTAQTDGGKLSATSLGRAHAAVESAAMIGKITLEV